MADPLSEMIQRVLRDAPFAMRQLAADAGLSYDVLRSWRSGRRRPSRSSAARLAAGLEDRGQRLLALAQELKEAAESNGGARAGAAGAAGAADTGSAQGERAGAGSPERAAGPEDRAAAAGVSRPGAGEDRPTAAADRGDAVQPPASGAGRDGGNGERQSGGSGEQEPGGGARESGIAGGRDHVPGSGHQPL